MSDDLTHPAVRLNRVKRVSSSVNDRFPWTTNAFKQTAAACDRDLKWNLAEEMAKIPSLYRSMTLREIRARTCHTRDPVFPTRARVALVYSRTSSEARSTHHRPHYFLLHTCCSTVDDPLSPKLPPAPLSPLPSQLPPPPNGDWCVTVTPAFVLNGVNPDPVPKGEQTVRSGEESSAQTALSESSFPPAPRALVGAAGVDEDGEDTAGASFRLPEDVRCRVSGVD